MQSQHIIPKQTEGLVVLESSEITYFLRQFQNSQHALLHEYQRQNMWSRRWVLVGFIILILVGTGASISYYRYSNTTLEKNFATKLQETTGETSQKVNDRFTIYQEKYREELSNLYRHQQDGQHHLVDSLLKLQLQQKDMQKFYEEKIMSLEKEKLSLQQINKDLRESWTLAELKLHTSANEIQSLQKQIVSLKEELAICKREIEHWKKIAGEKFSPEQWRTLKRDLEKDN